MKKPLGLRSFGLRKPFIFNMLQWCREGGEPPRGCPRRILSPFFALLQALARSRKNLQIASIHRGFSGHNLLHRIAPNRTKFRYKPAPKPAPELCPFFAIAPIGLQLRRGKHRDDVSQPLGGVYDGCAKHWLQSPAKPLLKRV